jgi:hypothetical protein
LGFTARELVHPAPQVLRPVRVLCAEVAAGRALQRLLIDRPVAPDVLWRMHLAYQELAEHIAREPSVLLPRGCL